MVAVKNIIAALGNFDGVHLGHQYLLKQANEFAEAHDAAAGAVLFEPHPRRYFRPDDPPFLLTLPEQRDALLRAAGAQEIFALTFDKALASMTPEAFVKDVLKDRLGLAGVVTGADFRFGKGRAGDGEALRSLGETAGLKVNESRPAAASDASVCASRIDAAKIRVEPPRPSTICCMWTHSSWPSLPASLILPTYGARYSAPEATATSACDES